MKKQSGGKKKSANGTISTVSKGKILERIAALMHDQPNITVKLNQRLPPVDGKGRQRREIDILLTGDIAGLRLTHFYGTPKQGDYTSCCSKATGLT